MPVSCNPRRRLRRTPSPARRLFWRRSGTTSSCGRLAPGAKLKIELLQERYQVGATPLREALSLLCATGLVERIEQRGFRVARVGAEELCRDPAVALRAGRAGASRLDRPGRQGLGRADRPHANIICIARRSR